MFPSSKGKFSPGFLGALAVSFIFLVVLPQIFTSHFRAVAQDIPTDEPTAEIEDTYAPSTYGLPNTIAGYKILAVLTPENTACMRSNARRLILQASEPDVESFLNNSRTQAVQEQLKRLDVKQEFEWELEFVGSNGSIEQLRNVIEVWNVFMKGGCVKLGPM